MSTAGAEAAIKFVRNGTAAMIAVVDAPDDRQGLLSWASLLEETRPAEAIAYYEGAAKLGHPDSVAAVMGRRVIQCT